MPPVWRHLKQGRKTSVFLEVLVFFEFIFILILIERLRNGVYFKDLEFRTAVLRTALRIVGPIRVGVPRNRAKLAIPLRYQSVGRNASLNKVVNCRLGPSL